MYILRSEKNPKQTYVGVTGDLKRRLKDHNSGKSIHTNKFKPWKLETYIAFSDQLLAEQFEEYLKQGTGWAFAKRHFLKD